MKPSFFTLKKTITHQFRLMVMFCTVKWVITMKHCNSKMLVM